MNLDFLKNSWMNNVNFLAQAGHLLAGYAIVLTAAFLSGTLAVIIISCLLIVYAALKEFWYDANFESPKQTATDNWLDFSFYIIGMIIGLSVIFLIKPHV